MKRVSILLILLLTLGCSTVQTPLVSMQTVGRAEAEVCVREFKEGVMVKETCVKSKSDAFSGWVVVGEIFNGAAEAIVKILTLGLL